jgi:tetratricopeptide (TPR) repeat protein
MSAHDMRQTAALLLFLLLLCPQAPAQNLAQGNDPRDLVKPDPKRAQKAAEHGVKAEADGHYNEALAYFDEAARYSPFDVTIVSRGAALRSKLVRERVEEGERQALEGNLEQATNEFYAALKIDPANTIVQERLVQMQKMEDAPPRKPERSIEGLPRLQPQSGRHSFNLHTDTKNAYEQVAGTYGIKASFDPDLAARSVRLRVENVDFVTAMSLLGAETATFYRPLNPALIFVAAETQEKRKEYGVQAEQTFPLPAAVGPEEMTELLRVLREITGVTKIELDSRNRSLTLRDSPERLALAGELIRDVERARGEVLLEIELLEVDRGNASKLGITPPSQTRLFSLSPQLIPQLRSAPDLTSLLTLLAGIFGGAATGGALNLTTLVPSVVAVGGGRTTLLLTVPGGAADFSQGLSLVHSGRQILLRAQDGKPATFFVGDRYPVTLSLLSGSLGKTTFTPNPGGTSITLPIQQFNVGQGPVALVNADFRNNGLQDLAVVNQIDNSLTILLNQGPGVTSQFVPTSASPISLGTARTTAPAVPVAIASASLNPGAGTNQDSFPDLLVSDPVGNTVTAFLGDGAGGFTQVQGAPISVGKQPSAIAPVQFTVGGVTNFGFVVTNFTDNTYSVFTGNGNGTFAQVAGSPFALPTGLQGPIAMTVGDFNGDGKSDLAIVTETNADTNIPQGSVTALQGNGDGTFTPFPGSPFLVGRLPVAIASGSLNGSSGPALAVVNQADNTLSVLFGKGDGTFAAALQSPFNTGLTPAGVVIADFLGQGNGGIAVTNTGANTISVFVDLGSGIISRELEPGAGTSPGAIVAAPFTKSSLPDVAVANNISGAAGQVTLIPSPSSLFSNSSIGQQFYPGSEFIDLGVKIKATPGMHPNNEVTLQLEFEIKALAGASLNGIPIISNRTLTQTVRVKEDETTLIGGLLDREETRAITGLPGFAELPGGVGYAFGRRDNSLTDRELLILITPHKMRLPSRDSRTIFAGRGDFGGRGSIPANAAPGNPQQ